MSSPAQRDELSRSLRDARLAAMRQRPELTAAEVGRRVGFSPAKMSRFENGTFVPKPDEAEAILRAIGAPAGERRRIMNLAKDVREQTSPRLVLARDASGMQQRIARIEAQSAHIGTFANTLVPGLLQTKAYMRVVFGSIDLTPEQLDAAVEGRAVDRQGRLGASARPTYTQILTEGVLSWHVGAPALMFDQCEHLIEMARLGGNLRVGVIPASQPVEQFPLEAFDVYDRGRAVLMGTYTATAFMTQPVDTRAYQRLFTQLEGHAAFGEEAVPVFERWAGFYRSLVSGRSLPDSGGAPGRDRA